MPKHELDAEASKRAGRFLFFLASLAVTFYPASAVAGQDDDVALWKQGVRARIGDQSYLYYTDDQLDQIAQLVWTKAATVQSQEARAKLMENAKQYVARHASQNTMIHFDGDGDNAKSPQVSRTPCSWELTKYDLEKRMERALATPKEIGNLDVVPWQVDQIIAAARTRLYAFFDGPGAAEFVESQIKDFKEALQEYARSDLEFYFTKALTDAEMKELVYKVSTYVPSNPFEPKTFKDDSLGGSGLVHITDAKNPPFRAHEISTAGLLGTIETFLSTLSKPKDFYDQRYKELRKKMKAEFDAACEELERDPKSASIKLESEPGLSKDVRSSARSKGSNFEGSDSGNSSRKSRGSSGSESASTGIFGRAFFVLLGLGLLALGTGVYAYRSRRAVHQK